MRFTELLELGPTRKLININDSLFEQLVDGWTREMGEKKLFGYQKATRVEHFQEAVDTVYTTLEGELQTTDPRKILAHPKWKILVGCASRNFPEHLAAYQPSPVEQTRVKRMIRNTLATRIITNKIDLLDIIKKDKTDHSWTLAELAVSRLRYELLAASATRVHDQYMTEVDTDWTTWYEWNSNTVGLYQGSTSVARSAGSTTTGFGKGIIGLAEGSAQSEASVSAAGSADLSVEKEWQQGRLKQSLKGNLQASGQASGHASGAARMDELRASAAAGIGAEASLRADIDYELTYSCKVKGEYLRRLLGGELDMVKVHASGSAEVHARAGGSAGTTAGVVNNYQESAVETDLIENSTSATRGFHGLKADLEGEVSLAVVMNGQGSVTVGQMAEVELGGDLFAGGIAAGNLQCFVNGQGVGMDIGGKLFAGFEFGSEQKVALQHPGRGVNIFTLQARESMSFGVGIAAKLAAKASIDEVSFDTSAGATLGVGSSISASCIISPRGLLLVGYDAIAMPALMKLAKTMKHYNPGSVHTRRLITFAQFLNDRASDAELSQVYMDCRGRMVALVSNLDLEADAVQKRAARVPGFNGYGDVMGINEINAVEGFVGNAQSKYFQYATEQITKDDGTVLQSKTVRGERKKQVVAEDMTALLRAAKDYAGLKKTLQTGECIAFDVIKRDIKTGQLAYA
ncbi:hypothetical protein [Endozoicomonas sp. ALB091]|uniref:hypothetical protein n=1 Tax=Endozoicomonas sp. ALB091 TaxID=3403073 RepID=UPI003BB7351D